MTQEWLCKPSSATWLLQIPSETSVVWPADRPEYRDTASNWCTHPTADPSPIYCSFWSKFKSSRNNQSCSYLGREVFFKKDLTLSRLREAFHAHKSGCNRNPREVMMMATRGQVGTKRSLPPRFKVPWKGKEQQGNDWEVYCLPDVPTKIVTGELIQEVLAPLFQSAYQLASQNLVVKPTSLQIFPEEVRVNVLDERSQRWWPYGLLHLLLPRYFSNWL